MDEEPAFGDALDFTLTTDLTPSDQFMAAIMWSLYETFQSLFCFLAQVATKTRTLAVFYGVLDYNNMLSRMQQYFLVLRIGN